ncbi:Dcp1p-Dcp2p decapping enzyme complex alpha subunit [Coemansia sp. RSA 1290]|nr:Dcp1p-Dcp2p decapping enzyme complex alpha subunit [Coemansia sp. RSA 1290]
MVGEIPTIPGHQLPAEAVRELRQILSEMTRCKPGSFPGSQPVSFTRTQSIPALLKEDYFVCEKSDGVRVLALMLLTTNGPQTFFITRKNEYFYAPNTFFPVPNNDKFNQFHNRTLIDAELVVDREPDGRQVRKLLGFDALVVNGTSCMERKLEKRLGYLAEHIVKPFNRMCQHMRFSPEQAPVVVAEMKHFHRGYGVANVYDEIIPQLKHESDGLIFTSVDAPYTIGTCDKIIKWKPANENSIDFKLSVRGPGEIMLMMWRGNSDYQDFGPLALRPEDVARLAQEQAQLDGRIAEVVYDPEYAPPAQWRMMRFREDKDHGNHMSVVQRIIDSIKDGVSLDELRSFMPQIRENWKHRHNEL